MYHLHGLTPVVDALIDTSRRKMTSLLSSDRLDIVFVSGKSVFVVGSVAVTNVGTV